MVAGGAVVVAVYGFMLLAIFEAFWNAFRMMWSGPKKRGR
jgi:hypothetical protein